MRETLERHGYEIYDSHYLGWSADGGSVFENEGFEVVDVIDLSTGEEGLVMVNRHSNPGERLRRLNSIRERWIQTDLITIPRERKAEFESWLG